MTERSYPWDDVFAGDALAMAPYLADDWTIMLHDMLGHGGSHGVCRRIGNELIPSCPGNASPVLVNTGSAFVAGQYYRNTASASIPVPYVSGAAIRYDRIVIRRTWATKQSRLTRIPGVDNAGTPALVQDWGTIYDVPIAIVRAQNTGEANAIYVTDDRQYRNWLNLLHRQGGDGADWGVPGTTDYPVLNARIQVGNGICDWATGTISVTFPVAFSGIPLVFLTTDAGTGLTAAVITCDAAGFTGDLTYHFANPANPHGAGAGYNTFNWLAIGPE